MKIRDISLSRTEPFGTRDTASEFGTVPKNLGQLATLLTILLDVEDILINCFSNAADWILGSTHSVTGLLMVPIRHRKGPPSQRSAIAKILTLTLILGSLWNGSLWE